MITTLDSRVMDANSEHIGVSVETLMGNAGKEIADYISANHKGKRIAFFCGHGNNGGDGFAAIGNLQDFDIQMFCIDPPEKIRSNIVKEYLKKTGKTPQEPNYNVYPFDVLVDCGLGTGLSGSLRKQYLDFVEYANGFNGTVISVDVPTGFGTEKQIIPDITLTMHDVKEGMTNSNCGKIIIADIKMPEKAYLEVGPGDFLRYPVPEDESHKGSNGKLLIIGGGPYYGAPAMSGMAALRIGTDLVTIATPENVFHEIASVSPVLMIHKLSGDHLTPGHIQELLELSEKNDAVLIGPGLGKNPETIEAVKQLAASCKKPMVIDADGITALGNMYRFDEGKVILTPHAREFMSIGGTIDKNVPEISEKMNCTILLKGKSDIICHKNRTRYNTTGCSGMTGAGTGDVLSGLTAGLLSKSMNPFDAACLGAYISGKAGELAFAKLSYGMIATDVIDCIPSVLIEGLSSRK